MIYKVMKRQSFQLGPYEVVPIRLEDMYLIMQWRNDQMDVLRQKNELTKNGQKAYFDEVVVKLFNEEMPKQILFSYLKEGTPIGYGGLVHIDWTDKRAEISFLLDSNRIQDNSSYAKEFSTFLSLMKEVAFRELSFNRIFTETYDIRENHIKVLESNGFRLEGRMRQHVRIGSDFCDSLIHGCLSEDETV